MKKHSIINLLLTILLSICTPISSMKRGRKEDTPSLQSPDKSELMGQSKQKRIKAEKETVSKKSTKEQEFHLPAELQNEEMVTLLSVDGDEITMPIILAEQNETLKHLIDDAGTDSPLTLPNINNETLATLISLNSLLYPFLKANAQIEKYNQNKAPVQQKNLIYIPHSYQLAVNNIVQDKTIHQLISLIEAANYLDNKFILNAMAAAIADIIYATYTSAYKITPEGRAEKLNQPIREAKDKIEIFLKFNQLNLIAHVKQYILRHLVFRQKGITQEYRIADYINEHGIPKDTQKAIPPRSEVSDWDLGSMLSYISFGPQPITSLFGINNLQINLKIRILSLSNSCLYKTNLDVQPGSLERITSLEALDLSGSLLAEIPENMFRNLNRLRFLNIGNNSITKLSPDLLRPLTNLEVLYLGNNKPATLPANIFRMNSKLRYLDLSKNDLTNLPSNVFKPLSNLKQLYLSGNKFTSLPNDIFTGLGNLQLLSLSNNQLIQLEPNNFTGLDNLEVLLLANNYLTQLAPNTFAGLDNLEELDFSNNQLRELAPGAFTGLNNLESLNLSNNQLGQLIPHTFAGLNNLQVLYLSNNQLKQLTKQNVAGLDHLEHLEELDISNNQLTQEEIHKIEHALPDVIILTLNTYLTTVFE